MALGLAGLAYVVNTLTQYYKDYGMYGAVPLDKAFTPLAVTALSIPAVFFGLTEFLENRELLKYANQKIK